MTTTSFDDQEPTLRQKAEEWMASHSTTMDLFRRFAMQLLALRRRFSIRLLSERVRWEFATDKALNPEDFKINDHFTPYIARSLIREEPALAELIECRVTKAADLPHRPGARLPRVDPLTDEPLDGGDGA
jgi:hypothetical protein